MADEVRRWLTADGHEVFLDRDRRDGIAVGEEWEQRLHERLRWADAVVCVVTAAYLRSVWCTAEVGIARSRGSRVLPVLAGTGVGHPLLPAVQHVDAVADPAGARAALAEALRRVDAGGGLGWPDGRSPFPGLRPFDVDQHRVFFGRAAEVEQLAARLRSPAEHTDGAGLLVVGPSGCGKSSLVRAGLLPLVAAEPGWWTVGPVLPGRDPVAALARELAYAGRRAGLTWVAADVRHRLDTDGLIAVADDVLVAAPGAMRRRLLVVVDQFEELLTQAPAPARARFAQLLRPALEGPVQLVATLRSEFLDPLLIDPELADVPQHTHLLQPLRRDALRAVIEGPAQLAGIDVDDELVARLVDDTGGGEALPLLAFTLAELADGVEHGGRLRATRYEQLGGVQGALARQADAALADAVRAGGRSPDDVIAQLLRLVTVDEQGRPTRWRTRRAELSDTAVTELDAFVARRLLTSDSDGEGNGGAVISVAHEAFLSAWPPLATAIAEASTALRARRGVEQAADAWVDSGRPADRLWDGGHLAAALADTGARVARTTSATGPRQRIVTDRVELNERAREFLHRSIRRDRHRRRRATTVLSFLLAVALVAAVVAVGGQRTADEQRQIATARQLIAQSEEVRDRDQQLALRLALAAHTLHDGPETQSSLAATVTGSRAVTAVPGGSAIAVAPERKLLAVGGQGVHLWELTEPGPPTDRGLLLNRGDGNDGQDDIDALAFTPNGQHLVTVGYAPNPADPHDPLGLAALTVWDVSRPADPRRITEPVPIAATGAQLMSLAILADGRTLAVAESPSEVKLWDIRNPAGPVPYPTPIPIDTWAGSAQRDVAALAAVGESTLAVAGTDGWVAFYQVTEPGQPVLLGEIPGDDQLSLEVSVAFADSGHTVALGRKGVPVTLWDVTDPHQPARLGNGIPGSSGMVAFAQDGHTLATAGDSVLLWDVSDPNRPRQIGRPFAGEVPQALAFVSDGTALAIADQDTAVWSVAEPGRPGPIGDTLSGPEGGDSGTTSAMSADGTAVAIAPDGRTVVTAGGRLVRVWRLNDAGSPREFGPRLPGRLPVVFVDADTLIVPEGKGIEPDGRTSVQMWSLADPAGPRKVGAPYVLPGRDDPVTSLAVDPTGRVMATNAFSRDIFLWDVVEARRGTEPHRELAEPLRLDKPMTRVLAFAPDGRMLAASAGGKVVLWDLTDVHGPRRVGTVDAAAAAMVFVDGGAALLVAGAGTDLEVWDLREPQAPRRTGGTPPGGGHQHVALSPDGGLLATADDDGGVVLWDLTNRNRPRQLGPALQDGTAVVALAFGGDGQTLATATGEGTTRLWDLRDLHRVRGDATKTACAIAGGGLTPDEWTRYVSGLGRVDSCAG